MYVAGVATVPGAVLAWWLILLLLKWSVKGLEVVLMRIPDHERGRAVAGGVAFAGKRAWAFTAWEVGVVLVVGQRQGQRGRAIDALHEVAERINNADN